MKLKVDFLNLGWYISVLLLFIYSFTQIDLGLTLTRLSIWQEIQTRFQYIGYFNRPLSAALCLSILILLTVFYFLQAKRAAVTPENTKQVWLVIIITALILWLAYNAFSYDLFNYVFDAKILTFYHLNPYNYKALDFPNDPMLGFMHWTHRLYPYGPAWLAITLPVSILGFQKLVLTLLLFKALIIAGYFMCCWSIFQIFKKIEGKELVLPLVLFALNPLVLVEGLVSAHNDLLMMGVALVAVVFLLERKLWPAWLLLVLSIGLKFATGALLPIFFWLTFFPPKKPDLNKILLYCGLLMAFSVIAASIRTEIQPWYLLYVLPFAALSYKTKWFYWPVTVLSLGLLLQYLPYLYLGNWDPPVPAIKFWLTISLLAIGALYIVVSFLIRPRTNAIITPKDHHA
jgi:hypothetical protein